MVRKKTGSNLHNKFAAIALIILGLLVLIAGVLAIYLLPNNPNTSIAFLLVGAILTAFGVILFKKSFK